MNEYHEIIPVEGVLTEVIQAQHKLSFIKDRVERIETAQRYLDSFNPYLGFPPFDKSRQLYLNLEHTIAFCRDKIASEVKYQINISSRVEAMGRFVEYKYVDDGKFSGFYLSFSEFLLTPGALNTPTALPGFVDIVPDSVRSISLLP